MSRFIVHTKQTTPAESVPILEQTQRTYGFIPNLMGVLSESPATAKAYLTLGGIFDESSFTATERQVVLLTTSRINECHYCMAAHSTVAEMQKVPGDVVDAIRDNQPIEDVKLEALRVFTSRVVERRGWVGDEHIQAFLGAGYDKQQIIEVILGIALKSISNYVNHISETPVDDAFGAKTWKPVNSRSKSA